MKNPVIAPSSLGLFSVLGYLPIYSKSCRDTSSLVLDYFNKNRADCLGLAEVDGRFIIESARNDVQYPYIYLPESKVRSLAFPSDFLRSDLYLQLCDHFRTYLKIANIAIWITETNSFYNGGSFIWHRDSMPQPYVKLLFYLNNINTVDEGAFRIIPITNRSIKYVPSYHTFREPDIPPSYEYAYTLSGCAGSGIIFDPNCLHFAGRSTTKDSAIASFHLIPHHSHGFEFYSKHSSGIAPCREYSIFPFASWW